MRRHGIGPRRAEQLIVGPDAPTTRCTPRTSAIIARVLASRSMRAPSAWYLRSVSTSRAICAVTCGASRCAPSLRAGCGFGVQRIHGDGEQRHPLGRRSRRVRPRATSARWPHAHSAAGRIVSSVGRGRGAGGDERQIERARPDGGAQDRRSPRPAYRASAGSRRACSCSAPHGHSASVLRAFSTIARRLDRIIGQADVIQRLRDART